MEIQSVLTAFAALSQESRLKVFRLLVQCGAEGLAAGTIASQLGITPATMSHHLEQLSQAGLLSSRREGRSIIYSANYGTMQNLINFLLENCCEGEERKVGKVGKVGKERKSDCCTEIITCNQEILERKPIKVVFACVHNAGRSQMAAAFFNLYCHQAMAYAVSAGTKPVTKVHPEVLQTMKEEGFNLAEVRPQLLTDKLAEDAEMLVTMGCGETCPTVPGLKRADWALQDPKGQSLERVREIRDQVKQLVQKLVDELRVAKANSVH